MAETPKAPAGAAGKWVRALISFGVGIALGLAPYLGTQQVPLFRPLLDLVPRALRDTTIPISAGLMGLVGAAVQFYDAEKISKKRIRTSFGCVLTLAVIMMFVFMWIQSAYVVRVEADGGAVTASFVVAANRLPSCRCPPGSSDAQCINGLSWDEAEIAACWGDRPIRLAGNIVRTSYLVTTTLFGVVIGLLVLSRSVTGGPSDSGKSQGSASGEQAGR